MNTAPWRARIWRALVLGGVLAAGLASAGAATAQDYFRYPPYGAHRGRMVYRNGLFHSERYLWGGGITPAGAQVLTHAIDVVGPLLPVLVGGGRGMDEQTRETPRAGFTGSEEYAREQQRATAAMERVEKLLLSMSSSQPAPASELQPLQPAGPGSTPAAPEPAALLEKLKKEYDAGAKANPWKK